MKIVEPTIEVYFHYPARVRVEHGQKLTSDLIVPEKFLEWVGRTCYKSEGKITDDSAEKFIGMLDRKGHKAMLEHCYASVKFVCDRGLSHELVRHRIASFAQESTRYCDYTKDKFGNEIAVIRPLGMSDETSVKFKDAEYFPATQDWLKNLLELLQTGKYPMAEQEVQALHDSSMTESQLWRLAMQWSDQSYHMLCNCGAPAQRARHVLPIGLKTEVWTSADLREWQHIFELRCSKAAHPHIRSLMLEALDVFRRVVPVMFGPIWEKYDVE